MEGFCESNWEINIRDNGSVLLFRLVVMYLVHFLLQHEKKHVMPFIIAG